MFSSGAPTTTFSAPSTAWFFSFNVSSGPLVGGNPDSNGFDVAFTNFTYQLGAANVVTTPARIRFFCQSITCPFGLFNVDILATAMPDDNPITGFEFSGAQAFSGSTSSPTILTGAYSTTAPTNFFSGDSTTVKDFFSGAAINITAPTGTPEPATFAMVAAACGLLAWMRRRQSAR
jgi:hypothetical protein